MWKSIESDPCSSRTWNKTQLEWLSWCLLSKLLAVLVDTEWCNFSVNAQDLHFSKHSQGLIAFWECLLSGLKSCHFYMYYLIAKLSTWSKMIINTTFCKATTFSSEALRILYFLNNVANTSLYFVQKMKACWWRKLFTTPCSCMCYLFQECQPSTCQ